MTSAFDINLGPVTAEELRRHSRIYAEEFLKKADSLAPLVVDFSFCPAPMPHDKGYKRTFLKPIYSEEYSNRLTIHICEEYMKEITLPAFQGWIDQELARCILKRKPDIKQFNFSKQILPLFPISGAGINFIRHLVEHIKIGLELYLATNIIIEIGHGIHQAYFYFYKINLQSEEGDNYRRIISHGWIRASFLSRKLKEIMPIKLLAKKNISFSRELESSWWQYHQYLVKEDRRSIKEIIDLPEQFAEASYSMKLIKMFQAFYEYLIPSINERTNSGRLY